MNRIASGVLAAALIAGCQATAPTASVHPTPTRPTQ
jgi:hypothetical protein